MNITKGNLPYETYLTIKKSMGEYKRYPEIYSSVTQLLQPPKFFYFAKRNPEIEKPGHTLLSAMEGNAWHNIHERALKDNDEYIVEQRMFTKIKAEDLKLDKDIVISGKPDAINTVENILIDFKNTNTYVVKGDLNIGSWEKQLNIYKFMLEYGFVTDVKDLKDFENKKQTMEINSLEVQACSSDWSPRKNSYTRNYPKPVEAISIMPHAMEHMLFTIRALVVELEKYKDTPIEEIPHCSREERWADRDEVAVMKKGRKSALRVLPNTGACKKYIMTKVKKKDRKKCYLQKRPAENTRCRFYCYYKDLCEFGRKLNEKGIYEGDDAEK